jgi:hypothetical protein
LGAYLALVSLSLFSRKFIGLELATLVQLGFLSIIQNKEITTYSQPMTDWSAIFGYSDLYFSPLPEGDKLRSPYALLGFKKFFGYSNNLMVLVAGCIIALAVLLNIASMLTSKSTSRRIKHVGFMVANELAYSVIVFITPSMVTSLCIEVQGGVIFETNPYWSKAFLVGGCLLLVVAHFMQLSTAEENPDVGTFLRKHSKMGIYMPIIFNARLILITTLLFVYQITPTIPSYFIIVTQLGYTLFVAFGRPHKKLFDILRSACLEIGLLYVLVGRFAETKILAEYVNAESVLYPVIAYLEYSFYALGVAVSTASMVYHLIKKFRGKKVYDRPE